MATENWQHTEKRTESLLFLFNPNTGEELMLELMFHIPNGKNEFEVI